ncbi:MAG: cell division protein FtsB [Betaproteobacteria bacterium]|nr:cell division protein FtsB [Betaproteobacteria bacterium]
MRWLASLFALLLLLIQYPLWLGKGGWLRVWEYDRKLNAERTANQKLETRNAGLDAEVRDLKQGYDAIEERARFDLGMTRQDESFVQIPGRPVARADTPPPSPPDGQHKEDLDEIPANVPAMSGNGR